MSLPRSYHQTNTPHVCGNRVPLRDCFLLRSGPKSFGSFKGVNRRQLEHIIRAAAGNADTTEVVIIGSQAILGAYPNAPLELLRSMEADVFTKDNPAHSILIDGAIGERSIFHETFGYYAHGVDENTAVLPEGWKD